MPSLANMNDRTWLLISSVESPHPIVSIIENEHLRERFYFLSCLALLRMTMGSRWGSYGGRLCSTCHPQQCSLQMVQWHAFFCYPQEEDAFMKPHLCIETYEQLSMFCPSFCLQTKCFTNPEKVPEEGCQINSKNPQSLHQPNSVSHHPLCWTSFTVSSFSRFYLPSHTFILSSSKQTSALYTNSQVSRNQLYVQSDHDTL